jgi:nucleoside-diphosphate-sugar epimerase
LKILVAGATGVVGRRLVPLLVHAGHEVAGTTRSAERARSIADQKARPVILDALDAGAVREAVLAERPDAIVHQLTDLTAEDFEANSRLRITGTANLVRARRASPGCTCRATAPRWRTTRSIPRCPRPRA